MTFLKEHSEYYHDIDLNAAVERAQQLPEDGSVAGKIQSVEFEKDLPLSQGQQKDDTDRRPSPAVVPLPHNSATSKAHGVQNEDEPILVNNFLVLKLVSTIYKCAIIHDNFVINKSFSLLSFSSCSQVAHQENVILLKL